MVWIKQELKANDIKNGGDILYRYWNQDEKSSRVIEVWRNAPNVWSSSVNNSWLCKEGSKREATAEAQKYMKRFP